MEVNEVTVGFVGSVVVSLVGAVGLLYRRNQEIHKEKETLHREKNDDAKAHTKQLLTMSDKLHKAVDLMEVLFQQTTGTRAPTPSTQDTT